jgi:two-component system OmpR family sensor kinase
VSIRLRLALSFGGLTGLVVLLVGIAAYSIHSRAEYDDLDLLLQSAADHATGEYAQAQTPNQRASVLADPASPGVVLRIYDANGQLGFTSPNATGAPLIDPRPILTQPSRPAFDRFLALAILVVQVTPDAGRFGLTADAQGTRWRVYVRPVDTTQYLEALASLGPNDASVARFRTLVPLLALLGTATTLVGGWFVASRALRPVATLTETASTIADSRDFKRRVPVESPRDELGQLADTFNGMLASLEQAYQIQRRFVSDASHEMRAPLTAIQANLEILGHQATMTVSDRQEAVDEASRETYRLSRLVADLLALARADAGTVLKRQRVELDRVVLDVLRETRLLAHGQRVDVVDLVPILVEGDADRLKQLVLILVDNALKYTPPDGQVSLCLRRDGTSAEVTVADSGVGISVYDLPHLFERFYRADPARALDPSGTGLGLPIARWIAHQHGGEVVLTSTAGKGTTATVRLPIGK